MEESLILQFQILLSGPMCVFLLVPFLLSKNHSVNRTWKWEMGKDKSQPSIWIQIPHQWWSSNFVEFIWRKCVRQMLLQFLEQIFTFKFYFCLSERVTQRETDRQNSIYWFSFQLSKTARSGPGLNWRQELNLSFPCRGHELSNLNCCFLRWPLTGSWGWEWNEEKYQDANPDGHIWDVDITGGVFTEAKRSHFRFFFQSKRRQISGVNLHWVLLCISRQSTNWAFLP